MTLWTRECAGEASNRVLTVQALRRASLRMAPAAPRFFLAVLSFILGAICLLSAFVLAVIPARAQDVPTPTPVETGGMSSFQDRLAPPSMPENPTQADLGAQVYYQVCMVCHGDRGQGLTDEWRGVLDPEDQNCWQSGCHGTRHPADGFVFPKIVPSVIGPATRARFSTAFDLYIYIKTRMPWQWPGTRSDEEYWQLTAFLLRENGIDPGLEPLQPATAAIIRLKPKQAEQTPTPSAAPGLLPSGILSYSPSVPYLLAILLIAFILTFSFLVKWYQRAAKQSKKSKDGPSFYKPK